MSKVKDLIKILSSMPLEDNIVWHFYTASNILEMADDAALTLTKDEANEIVDNLQCSACELSTNVVWDHIYSFVGKRELPSIS